MEDAAREEATKAKELNEVDKHGVPCITVVTDGAWGKRSYNVNYHRDASSGVACIISRKTKKVPYLGIMTNELETEVSQPNEPPISRKRIVNIASLLQRVIKVSENHARTCTSGSLSIDKEIRRGLESTIVLKCMMCEKTFTCSTIDLKYENINKEAVWGTLSGKTCFNKILKGNLIKQNWCSIF
ncbi:hypothetical protein FQR65_LT15975 [Abscondita terminalis]|nr:hypothetical protein FQR65_LT15975 [Abscondita terminalis]